MLEVVRDLERILESLLGKGAGDLPLHDGAGGCGPFPFDPAFELRVFRRFLEAEVGKASRTEVRDREPHCAGCHLPFEVVDEQGRCFEVADVHLGLVSRDDDLDREPGVELIGDRGAVALPVVELPRRQAVEHGSVLVGVGVSGLV